MFALVAALAGCGPGSATTSRGISGHWVRNYHRYPAGPTDGPDLVDVALDVDQSGRFTGTVTNVGLQRERPGRIARISGRLLAGTIVRQTVAFPDKSLGSFTLELARTDSGWVLVGFGDQSLENMGHMTRLGE
jgi:hypothetical protein